MRLLAAFAAADKVALGEDRLVAAEAGKPVADTLEAADWDTAAAPAPVRHSEAVPVGSRSERLQAQVGTRRRAVDHSAFGSRKAVVAVVAVAPAG